MAIEAISGRILAVIFLHDWRWCSSNDLRVPYSRCMASVTVGGWKLIHQQVQNEPFLVSSLSPWRGESQRFETRADELSCHLTGMHAKWLQLEHNCGCDRWKRPFSLLVDGFCVFCQVRTRPPPTNHASQIHLMTAVDDWQIKRHSGDVGLVPRRTYTSGMDGNRADK